jgi:plastocyanin
VKRFLRGVTATVGAGALVLGIGLSGVGTAAAAAPTHSSAAATVTVKDNYFQPASLEVTAGTKVTWTNQGKVLHNVRPVKGSKWGTKALVKGKDYSYKFKKPGTYAYYCSFHGSPTGGQRGTIVVTAAAPATTTTTAAR